MKTNKSKHPGLKKPMSKTDALLKILEKRGKLTPAAVVEEAKNPKHPLHALFCWDDTEAAKKYREIQAAQLIRQCKCVVTAEDATQQTVRVFHHVEDAVEPEGDEADTRTESHYAEIHTVLGNQAYMDQVIEDCRRDLEAFVSKYKAFAALSGIVSLAKSQLLQIENIESREKAANG